jgi:hypothetical protein
MTSAKRVLAAVTVVVANVVTVACIDSNSNEVDSGPTEAPSSGACWGADDAFCYSWRNVPASDVVGSCAELDAAGGGIGACPTANATGTCTTAADDGGYSVTSYSPLTACATAKSSCQGTFVGNGC